MFIEENMPQGDKNASCLMPAVIESQRLSLRRLTASRYNARRISCLISKNKQHLSTHFRAFCEWEDQEKTLSKLKQQEKCRYFIFHQEEPIGFIGLIEDETDREVQYWIDKDYEGKGFIIEALKAIEKEAFKINAKPLTLMIDAENLRSQKVAVNLNFQPIDSQKTEWVKTHRQYLNQQYPATYFQHKSNKRE